MDSKIVNIEDTPFVRRNQLLTASAISWISYSTSTGTTVIRIRRLSEDKSQDIAEKSQRLWYQWSPDGQALALSMEEKPASSNRDEFGTTRIFTVTVPEGS